MKVLIADPIAQEGIEALRAHAEVDVRLGLGHDELIAAIGDYDAIVVRSETKVSAEVIEAGQRLQVIGRAGVGVDNIDLEAATRKGIVVVNAPTGNTISAAEHAIALMLAMARNIPQANALLRAGEWRRHDFLGIEGVDRRNSRGPWGLPFLEKALSPGPLHGRRARCRIWGSEG